ncbi:hypothetical protein A2U01_0095276, partial [Trifolium medium]|nr:hypothetical protein [Trifolium medium]
MVLETLQPDVSEQRDLILSRISFNIRVMTEIFRNCFSPASNE